jgi:tetratricopeptide (TPR) repeat protein
MIATCMAAPLLTLALGAPAAGGEPPTFKLPKEDEVWVRVPSANFVVMSNAGARGAARTAQELERMRAAVGLFTRLNVRSTRPLPVLLFKDERSFAPLRDTVMGVKNKNFAGIYAGDELGGTVLVNDDAMSGSGGDRMRVVFHELTHYFVHNTIRELPLWLDEGLAEVYSTFRSNDKEIQLGLPLERSVLALRSVPTIPLDVLMAKSQAQFIDDPERSQDLFYPESWALVHYLLVDTSRTGQLSRYVALLASGSSREQAFTTAFATTPDGLQTELERYVRGLRFPFVRVPVADLDAPQPGPAEPLPRTALLTAIGRVLARRSDPAVRAQGEQVLRAALAADPTNAEAVALLGGLAERDGRTQEAAALYEKAVAAGSDRFEPYLLLGRFLLHNPAPASDGSGKEVQEKVDRARALLAHAVELAPGEDEPCSELVAAWDEGTPPFPADLVRVGRCATRASASEDMVTRFAMLCARHGGRDAALALARGRLSHGDGATGRAVLDVVADEDCRQAASLAAAGRIAESKEAYRRALDVVQSAVDRDRIAERISEIERYEKASADVALYNRAVAELNGGDPVTALATLDSLTADVADPDLRARASALRDQIRKATPKGKPRTR